MNRKSAVFAFIIVLGCLGILIAAAQDNKQEPAKQETGAPFKITVKTNLVLVSVIVTDNHGNHVSGLKAEDFEVKEDGNVQNIIRLDEVTAEAAKVERPAAAAPGAFPKTFSNQLVAAHPKKLEIIALDQLNTVFAGGAHGNRMLVEFLAKNVDANTLLALVVFTHDGVRVIHDFTSEPATLISAIKKVRYNIGSRETQTLDTPGDSTQADNEVQQLNAILSGDSPDLTNVNQSNPTNAAVAAARAQSRAQAAQVDAARQAQESLITLECFQQIAQYFGGVSGRKSLIWASTGFPFSLGSSAQANTRGTLNDDWERTFRMLTDANIAVYPVDIGGLATGANANNIQSLDSTLIRSQGPEGGVPGRAQGLAGMETGAYIDPTIRRQESMRQLADRTGGQAFYNSNDGAELFRRAGADSGEYYMLGYYTKDNGKYGWRKLGVKVRRENVKIRARSGFFFHNPATEPETARQAEEILAMSSDLDFTSLPVAGKWEQIEPAGNERKLRFALSVPAGVPFIDAENKNHLSFDFRVVVTDSRGQIAGRIGQRLDTNLPPDDVARIQSSGLDYVNEVTLAPGQYKAHFVVRDNLRGALGSIVTPVKVE